MLDLSVIILTGNEELHIKRCLDNVCPHVKEVFIIDCFSKDKTVEIARSYENVTVLQHEWPVGKYAEQFNYGIDNSHSTAKWILRLDADEYLLPETWQELEEKLPFLEDDVTGVIIKRRVLFLGRWMKKGIYPVRLLRIFRNGLGRCEERLMDEHIMLTRGRTIELDNDFVDENLNNLSWFCQKHVGYSVREAADLLDIEYHLLNTEDTHDQQMGEQAKAKRKKKESYAHKPLFWRSFAYFIYRYFAKGAFSEGKEGFIWTFIQGWWYRTLVDAKVFEIKKACRLNGVTGENISEEQKRTLREHLYKNYGIKL